jgi:hypothetical protein
VANLVNSAGKRPKQEEKQSDDPQNDSADQAASEGESLKAAA